MHIIAAIGLMLAIMICVALLISLPVMWLWDAVIPDLFGLHTITWIQALWLSILCSLLFKSSASNPKK